MGSDDGNGLTSTYQERRELANHDAFLSRTFFTNSVEFFESGIDFRGSGFNQDVIIASIFISFLFINGSVKQILLFQGPTTKGACGRRWRVSINVLRDTGSTKAMSTWGDAL